MKNSVFVRSKNSIFTISLNRIVACFSFLVIGLYLNVFLVKDYSINNIVNILSFPCVGLLIGVIVNFIFTKRAKKDKIIRILFSTFHIEYGIVLGFLMSKSVSLIVFTIILSIMFIISKLINIKINVMAITFILIYIVTNQLGGFEYVTRSAYTFKDYLIGNTTGGLFSTGIISLLISIFIIKAKNSSKIDISEYAIITYSLLVLIYSFVFKANTLELLCLNSYYFIFVFIASDSVSSSYTLKGVKVFGILVGLITFALSFKLKILAPFIAITITSFFATFIDKASNKLLKKN